MVRNIYSAISKGTEMASVEIAKKNLLQKAQSRPEDLKKVLKLASEVGYLEAYRMAMNKLELPAALGYSSVGEVIKVGSDVTEFSIGDIVSCAGSDHAELVVVPKSLATIIPKKSVWSRQPSLL